MKKMDRMNVSSQLESPKSNLERTSKQAASKVELSATKVNFDQQAAVARNSYEVYGWRPTDKQLRINLERRN